VLIFEKMFAARFVRSGGYNLRGPSSRGPFALDSCPLLCKILLDSVGPIELGLHRSSVEEAALFRVNSYDVAFVAQRVFELLSILLR
jgi:hypothetical protein